MNNVEKLFWEDEHENMAKKNDHDIFLWEKLRLKYYAFASGIKSYWTQWVSYLRIAL